MTEFVIVNMPDGLSAGTYGGKVKSAEWVGDKMQVTLELDAPITDVNEYDYLFKIKSES